MQALRLFALVRDLGLRSDYNPAGPPLYLSQWCAGLPALMQIAWHAYAFVAQGEAAS